MIKTRNHCLAATLCLCLAPTAIAQNLENPGFESEWNGWARGGPDPSGTAMSENARSGERSAKLTRESSYVSQIVQVQPDTGYRLSVWIKGAGNVGAKVGTDLFFEQTPKVMKDWSRLDVTFQTGSETAVAIFGSYAGLEGRFDDFSIARLDGKPLETSARILTSSAGGYGLSPDLPPGRNFDLLGWYLNTPGDVDNDGVCDRFPERELAAGATDERYFYTAEDGGMVFRATIAGARTSKNTRFTRTELREMLRRGDTSISTRNDDKTPNKNNWVFSSAPEKAQKMAGGVDGTLKATLAVNRVTSTGEELQVGEVVIGQIHAARDEPARLYFRKMPGHQRGSVYLAHEDARGDDIYIDLLGSRDDRSNEPADGIALDEKFSYDITAAGNDLYVKIFSGGEVLAETHVDMSNSGYGVENDFMYFKAGAYNQNDTGEPEDYAQVTFYELQATH